MNTFTKRIAHLGLGALWSLAAIGSAFADDTELFVGNSQNSQAPPNILFILDNSGSMDSLVETQEGFDGSKSYPSAGGCDASRVYWIQDTGNAPVCNNNNTRWFNLSALKCQAAITAFKSAGIYTDNMAQYNPSNGVTRWEAISTSQRSRGVECKSDSGKYGDGSDTTKPYARNGGTNAGGYWGVATDTKLVSWGNTPVSGTYTLYSGNFLNWAYGPTGFQTREEIVKDVAGKLLDSVDGVKVGLMTFNDSVNNTVGSQGGYVAYPLTDVATGRTAMKSAINALDPHTFTPLSETLYEAAQYYMGRKVAFGDPNSVPSSRDASNTNLYKSPIDYACQKNFVVYLTDGEPTYDSDADTKIKALQDANSKSFGTLVGSKCDVETYPAGFNPSGGDCLDDLAEFMYKGDVSSLTGPQNVVTYTIGFTVDLPNLKKTAQRGGGKYYTANDTAGLANALSNIVASILSTNTTFTSPTVAVNSFNRTQNLNDLFISVFRPSDRTHWPGNLKKYTLRGSDATIVDENDAPAIDPSTGFFKDTSQSYWSTGIDGSKVDLGGAANEVPDAATRKVYTYLGSKDLTTASNLVTSANTTITDLKLNIGNTGDPSRNDLFAFINGHSPILDEARHQMGDPLHSQPVAMIYGPGIRDGLLFFATNDGFLHALDVQTGVEQWAFVPPEFLGNQVKLYNDDSSASKLYGIDGDLRVVTVPDSTGVTIPGENAKVKVYLYFGMRRGGDFYYALDITNKNSPQLLFRLDNTTLPGVGQSWATPQPTHMNISGATQNAQKSVLVIGGGYEPDQDNSALSTDTIGNAIYIVDSVSGNLLWWGSSASAATKRFNTSGRSMDYSIPARVRVVDLDGDGFADRMYAADMGGQVWRFDVANGQTAANLINGGVIAQLDGTPQSSPAFADTRRFYYAPDVAMVNTKDFNFTHIGIGSGHREHPLSTDNHDRFYALRDYNTAAMTQTQFNALTLITDASLTPVTTANTTVPLNSPGWRLDLNIGGWQGEKVLAEARTFNNEVIFSTFMPSTGNNTCQPQLGINRVYQMSIFNGAPVLNLDGSSDPTVLTMNDLFVQNTGGILSTPQALFVGRDKNKDDVPDGPESDPVICVGLICFPAGFQNTPVRTFWTQRSLD